MDKVKCEALIAAAEGGSLSYAAELLGYTQPGITRMIDSLEDELGFPLLLRSKKGVTLTPNGERMMPYFREVVRSQRMAEETGASIRGILSGVLTVGCYYSVSSMLLPEVLRQFMADFPGVQIVLKEGTNAELSLMLRDHSVDLCFAAKPSEQTVCEWIPVLEDELTVWLPEEHPMAGNTRFPVRKLADYPFIMIEPGNDTDLDRVFSRARVHPDIHFETKDAFSAYRMVEAGLGISLNQRLISRAWGGKVVTLPFDPPQYVHLGIAIRSLADASPAAKKFVDYILRIVRQDERNNALFGL